MDAPLKGRVIPLFKEEQKAPFKMKLQQRDGQTSILVWWERALCPEEGAQISARGSWKSFRGKEEFHVSSFVRQEVGAYDHLFSYFSAIQQSMYRDAQCIDTGSAPGFFAHPEPEHLLCIPEVVECSAPWILGWPLIEGIPLFFLPISIASDDTGYLASGRGMISVSIAGLRILGLSDTEVHRHYSSFEDYGWTGVERSQALLEKLHLSMLSPQKLSQQEIKRGEITIENKALLFQFFQDPCWQHIQGQEDALIKKSVLGVYLGLRSPKYSPFEYTPDVFLPLNWEQYISVCTALSSELSVVTGPPGTGKSQVLIAACASAVLRGERVLIVSNNNRAIDQIFEKMRNFSPLVLPFRLGRNELWQEMLERLKEWKTLSREAQFAPPDISENHCKKACTAIFSQENAKEKRKNLSRIMPVLTEWGSYQWERFWRKLSIETQVDDTYSKNGMNRILSHPCLPIVGSTIASCTKLPCSPSMFDLIIIDEASQCDVVSIVPILWRGKRAMVIGDEKQLSPVYGISSHQDIKLRPPQEESLQYTKSSVFIRAQAIVRSILLKEHHRSRPEIISLSSHLFYDSKLQAKRKPKKGAIQWFDDPEDLPLSYSFGVAPKNYQSMAQVQTLGARATATSIVWQKPPAGNWTIICQIYDTFMATASKKVDITVEEVELTADKQNEMLAAMSGNADTGDNSGTQQVAGNLAQALNSQSTTASRRRASTARSTCSSAVGSTRPC